MSVALIDADLYLYRAAAGAVMQVEWERDVWTYLCDHKRARNSFEEFMDWVHERLPNHVLRLCLGDKHNFRYAFMPSYKSARRKQWKPAGYGELVEWATNGKWDWIRRDSLEGDDMVGILSGNGDDVIVSGDKDMKQLPGNHLLPDGSFEDVPVQDANLRFYVQALAGDHTDGYPGCPGIGEKRALRLLEDLAHDEAAMWLQVVATYREKGIADRQIMANALCARILRPGDLHTRSGRITYWSPPVALERIAPM